MHNIKMVDARGNSLMISGVVRYYWSNSVQTLLECESPAQYVELLATAVLKQVVSRYPHESSDGGPCLKTESAAVSQELINSLQERVSASGAKGLSLNINEVSRMWKHVRKFSFSTIVCRLATHQRLAQVWNDLYSSCSSCRCFDHFASHAEKNSKLLRLWRRGRSLFRGPSMWRQRRLTNLPNWGTE